MSRFAAEQRAGPVSLRHNRDYWWLWFGQAISVLGDEVFAVTLMLWIATTVVGGEALAPLAVTAVLVAETVPAIFLSPIAGVYCDRWDRRRIMLTADAVRCALIAAMAGIVFAAPALPRGRPARDHLHGDRAGVHGQRVLQPGPVRRAGGDRP